MLQTLSNHYETMAHFQNFQAILHLKSVLKCHHDLHYNLDCFKSILLLIEPEGQLYPAVLLLQVLELLTR